MPLSVSKQPIKVFSTKIAFNKLEGVCFMKRFLVIFSLFMLCGSIIVNNALSEQTLNFVKRAGGSELVVFNQSILNSEFIAAPAELCVQLYFLTSFRELISLWYF